MNLSQYFPAKEIWKRIPNSNNERRNIETPNPS